MRNLVPPSAASLSLERIGAVIRSARVLRRFTQAELAAAVGVSRPTVVAAEAGRSVSSHNLFALLGYLGASLTVGGAGIQNPAHRRPNIAELVSAERARRQRMSGLGKHAVAEREPSGAAVAPGTAAGKPSGRLETRRPRIGDLIAAERERRVRRPPDSA